VLFGGGAWRSFNVTAEIVDCSAAHLAARGMLTKLGDIVVRY
jgi:hypothetical protein